MSTVLAALFGVSLTLAPATCVAQSITSSAETGPVHYFTQCPDTELYVDAVNAANQETDEVMRAADTVVKLGILAGALVDCAQRLVTQSGGENSPQEFNDLYQAAWLHYVAADLYFQSITLIWWLDEKQEHRLSKSGADLIISAARLALSDLQIAKAQPFQRNLQNGNFLRQVSHLQIEVEDVVKKYLPDRATEIYAQ